MHLYFNDLYFDLSMFLMLLHAKTNLCGGDGGMIGLYGSYFCFHPITNYKIQFYNHLPEIDTTCNQGMHTSLWL